jgi:DNA-directed RNA polymerase subunit RPC12/RpoP
MQVEAVNCNKCGAPLEVSASTNFVTCAHCGSRLAIKRTGSSAFTETLERLDQKTDAMAQQLAELRYHAELERLDREWEQERRKYLTTDKHGKTHEPNAVGSIVMGLIVCVFGVIFMGSTLSSGAPCLFPVVGLAIIGFGIFVVVTGPAKARQFQDAQTAHERRKAALSVNDFLVTDSESSS